MVQQERERLPIDPTSIQKQDIYGLIYYKGAGRDKFEGKTFSHITNVGDLHETTDYVMELNAHGNGNFVVGQGIDKDQGSKRRKAILNHRVLAVWSELTIPEKFANLKELTRGGNDGKVE